LVLPDAGTGKLSAWLPMLATVAVCVPLVVSVLPTRVEVAKVSVGASTQSSFFTTLLF
jgi:hypothetical protein